MKLLAMKNLSLAFVTLALFISWPTFSQQEKTEFVDVVYLKNGSVFRGEMTEYKKGEQLTLKLRNGNVIVFTEAEIDKIVQEPIGKVMEKAKA